MMPPTLADAAAQLRDDEIHVWRLDYRAADKRAPLLAVLAAYLGTDVDRVVLTHGEHGRPMLADAHDPSLDFNWSHSGNAALVALGRGIKLGVDLERMRPRPRALEIAERYFRHDEATVLAAVPGSDHAAAFLALWTAKEAVLKALGRGIAFGLDRLHIARDAQQLTLLELEGDDASAWQLQRLPLDPDWVGALAWRGSARSIRLFALAGGD